MIEYFVTFVLGTVFGLSLAGAYAWYKIRKIKKQMLGGSLFQQQ